MQAAWLNRGDSATARQRVLTVAAPPQDNPAEDEGTEEVAISLSKSAEDELLLVGGFELQPVFAAGPCVEAGAAFGDDSFESLGFRGGEQLIDPQQITQPGTILVFLETKADWTTLRPGAVALPTRIVAIMT